MLMVMSVCYRRQDRGGHDCDFPSEKENVGKRKYWWNLSMEMSSLTTIIILNVTNLCVLNIIQTWWKLLKDDILDN